MGKKKRKRLKDLPVPDATELAASVPAPRRAIFDQPDVPVSRETEPPIERVSRETPQLSPFPRPSSPRIMVIANQKGGVGKTTTVVNVATALALGGLRVLVADLDPQGNASTALGIEHQSGVPGTYEVLLNGDPIAEHAQPSPEADTLMVLPATIDLAGADLQLASVVARERRLERALREYLASNDVDYVLLDCPPSLGLLTLNALVAAEEILIPIQCEYYALEGVSQLINTIDLVKGELNDNLSLSAILLTMYDGRTNLSTEVAAEVRRYYPDETLETMIPRSVRVSEAPSFGQSVLTYNPTSAGAVAYLAAAAEIAARGVDDDDEES